MAECRDVYSDFEELGITDEGEDGITSEFNAAAKHVQTLASKLDNKSLLSLYGYYKQATSGPCDTQKPSFFNSKARAKWDAWNKLGRLPQSEAKTLYVKLVQELDPTFSNKPNQKESWTVVSVPQFIETAPKNSEKTIADFIKENNLNKLREVLSAKGERNLDELDAEGLSYLHWAADRGSLEAIKLLLLHGADVNVLDSENQTPLHYAVSCGHLDCVKFLLENGARTDVKNEDGDDVMALSVGNGAFIELIGKYSK